MLNDSNYHTHSEGCIDDEEIQAQEQYGQSDLQQNQILEGIIREIRGVSNKVRDINCKQNEVNGKV